MIEYDYDTLHGYAEMNGKLVAELEALRAENARLLVRLEKAHSFIPRADWMQFFEEEHAAERADLESNND